MQTYLIIKLFVSLFLLSFVSNDKTEDQHVFEKFTQFNKQYSKNYSSFKEMEKKYLIFKDNYLKMLTQRNSHGNSTIIGITQFMDIPFEEFNRKYLSSSFNESNSNSSLRSTQQREYIPMINQDNSLNSNHKMIHSMNKTAKIPSPIKQKETKPKTAEEATTVIIPESFDWREKGAVSKVLHQGDCGACWAFSALVVVEGAYAKKYGRVYNISPQQIIDCNGSNFSCSFGQIMGAMTYLKSFSGIPIDQYPFEEKKGECRYESIHIEDGLAKVEEYHRLFNVDENEMKNMVYNQGPIAVNINAAYFQFYKGGIMDPIDCVPFVNHGVAIVGYGVENGIPYWIIKNSWGESWGEQGYMRLIRGKGQCGINTTVVTATII